MPSLSPEDISRLSAFMALTVVPGDVFFIPKPRARYFESTSGRPALVVRVQRSASGEASLVYLTYGTTKHVPRKRALAIAAGEADLHEDTTFDFGPWLELPATELLAACKPIGRLSDTRIVEMEGALAGSRLPFRGLAP